MPRLEGDFLFCCTAMMTPNFFSNLSGTSKNPEDF